MRSRQTIENSMQYKKCKNKSLKYNSDCLTVWVNVQKSMLNMLSYKKSIISNIRHSGLRSNFNERTCWNSICVGVRRTYYLVHFSISQLASLLLDGELGSKFDMTDHIADTRLIGVTRRTCSDLGHNQHRGSRISPASPTETDRER